MLMGVCLSTTLLISSGGFLLLLPVLILDELHPVFLFLVASEVMTIFSIQNLLAPLLLTKHCSRTLRCVLSKVPQSMPTIIHRRGHRERTVAAHEIHDGFCTVLKRAVCSFVSIRDDRCEAIVLRRLDVLPSLILHPVGFTCL